MYSQSTRTGKPGESQGRKVTGLTEGSYGRRTAEGRVNAMRFASSFPFSVRTVWFLLLDEADAVRPLHPKGGTRNVLALFGKDEGIAEDKLYGLLALQPPAQVMLGGRKNRPSPDLCFGWDRHNASVGNLSGCHVISLLGLDNSADMHIQPFAIRRPSTTPASVVC